MISLKVLSAAAAMALVVPMVAPSVSFAQAPPGMKAQGAPGGGGGGGIKGGGGGFGGGGVAPGPRFNGGGGGIKAGGGGFGPGPVAGGGGGYYRGGGGGGYYRHGGGGGGFIPGAVAGALIGGAIASQGYYGSPGYYAPGYYDDQYYDDSAVAVAPADDDAVAYCTQRFRSYDPRSGTYLGNDGYRHSCP